jgi:hypothetical protein
MALEKNKTILDALIRTSQFNEARMLCETLLHENRDHWDLWLNYFDIIGHDSSLNDNLTRALSFIKELVDMKSRGPSLALLKFKRDYGTDKNISYDQSEFEIIMQYLDHFGHLHCCFDDLRANIDLLADKKAFFDAIQDIIEKLISKSHVVKLLTVLKFKKYFAAHDSPSQVEFYLTLFKDMSKRGLRAFRSSDNV